MVVVVEVVVEGWLALVVVEGRLLEVVEGWL